MLVKGPRGTNDVIPSESYKWQYLEKKFREVCVKFGFSEIRTPVFEHTELFERGVGETTDVVQKEMYTFQDKGDRSITLKPEGTAPVVRSFIEHKIYAEAQPSKISYITPCFRYERPQAGRLRAFHQFGAEVFGSGEPSVDAEVISMVDSFLVELGLSDIELRINSIGCPICRNEYNEKLKAYLEPKLEKLCETCKSRFDKNPMRILDCKNEDCQSQIGDAPKMIDNLCGECETHFDRVQSYLKALGVDFIVDSKIVRGLDYYTKTAFEFISRDIGTQATVSGGGRYDGLVESLGGKSTPAVGFGMGIERLLLTLESCGIEIPKPEGLDIFIVSMGERADIEAFRILNKLRARGLSGDKDYLNRSIKAQFKYADKKNARYTVIIGDDELDKRVVSLKNMETGEQIEVELDRLEEAIIGGN